jgi:hypothetical protein
LNHGRSQDILQAHGRFVAAIDQIVACASDNDVIAAVCFDGIIPCARDNDIVAIGGQDCLRQIGARGIGPRGLPQYNGSASK